MVPKRLKTVVVHVQGALMRKVVIRQTIAVVVSVTKHASPHHAAMPSKTARKQTGIVAQDVILVPMGYCATITVTVLVAYVTKHARYPCVMILQKMAQKQMLTVAAHATSAFRGKDVTITKIAPHSCVAIIILAN
jgi:hypothetical protein